MKVLLIGLGRWGEKHLRVLRELGCEVWVADVSDERRAFAVKSGVPEAHAVTDFRSALPHVDAVDLVILEDTPTPLGHRVLKSGHLLRDVLPKRRTAVAEHILRRYLDEAYLRQVCSTVGSTPISRSAMAFSAAVGLGAVVIGGTSLAGGRATIVGTFLGVLTFALIFSLMTQLNLSTEVQQVTKGLIVLGAVLLQRPEARY